MTLTHDPSTSASQVLDEHVCTVMLSFSRLGYFSYSNSIPTKGEQQKLQAFISLSSYQLLNPTSLNGTHFVTTAWQYVSSIREVSGYPGCCKTPQKSWKSPSHHPLESQHDSLKSCPFQIVPLLANASTLLPASDKYNHRNLSLLYL